MHKGVESEKAGVAPDPKKATNEEMRVIFNVLTNSLAGSKARGFVLGAFYAGIGGALWAYQIRFVSADQFTLFNSIWFIAMMIVGGLGSIVGALIGTVLIRAVQETITSVGPDLLERFPALSTDLVFASMNVFLGLVITGFLLPEPKGLMHRWNIFKATYRLWPFPH